MRFRILPFAFLTLCALFGCRNAAVHSDSSSSSSAGPATSAATPSSTKSTTPVASALLADDLHEEVVRIPLPDHPGMTLEATIFRPSGAGPFPLVVMNHGAIGKRDPAPRWRPLAHARFFVSRGFVVAVPMRRGNAGSDGDWAEGYGPCESADFTNANRESASDVHAAVTFMAARPYVDPHRVLLHGLSAGGMAVLALASTSPKWDNVNIVGVLNFAGGRGSLSSDNGDTRHNCAPDALVATAGKFGQSITIPTLWLYAENDHFFPPPLAHRMFDAFSTHDTPSAPNAKFVQIPAFAREGHSMTWEAAAIPLWENDVARFLKRLKLVA